MIRALTHLISTLLPTTLYEKEPLQIYAWEQEAARKLLNDLMVPKVAAQNALQVVAATQTRSALALLPNLHTKDSTLFPSQEIINKCVIDRRLTANNINLRTKIINNVVKSYEAQH